MKVIRYAALFGAVVLGLASCSSLAGDIMSGAISGSMRSSAGSASSDAARAAPPAVVDFQSGEILASQENGKMADASYHVARVLQAASPSTNNQAQVIFVSDGKKYWVNYSIESRKADKSDLKVGAMILYLAGWQQHDEISADSYRKDRWELGNVTSVDELFKGRVEINGDSFNTNYLRVPTSPIK